MPPFEVPLTRPDVGQEELDAVARVFESGFLTEGPETSKFEQEFAEYLGVKHAVATSSGTTALYLALTSLDVGRGDEVIVPDYTFPATGNVVYHCGAHPVLCDIRLQEFQIDPNQIESLITSKTKVVMPVSEFGLTADMKPIVEIAEKHGLKVVEDACPGLGSKREGYFAGTMGDVGCFSFHPRKPLAIGEGGMLVTNNEAIAEKARVLKNHGQTEKWNFKYAGYNFRLSDVQSAIGRVQLRKLDRKIKEQRRLAGIYNEELSDFLEVPPVPSGCVHTYQSYVTLLDQSSEKTIEWLRARGVEAQIGTSCLHILKSFEYARRNFCSQSYKAWLYSMTLPLFAGMTDSMQSRVIDEVSQLAEVAEARHS